MEYKKKFIKKIDKKDIFKITLTNNQNYSVSFFNFGGYIHNIQIPYHDVPSEKEDVLLGYKEFTGYLTDTSYLNCLVGRVSGRINNSQFFLNNKKYKLFANDGKHHLHGGREGFNKKTWLIENIDKNSKEIYCNLSFTSSDLEEGYPGNLKCSVKFSLNNKNEFLIKLKAISDKDTIVNLTNHNYWNFNGHQKFYNNLSDHKIKIFADSYCEVDDKLIPTGKIIDIKNTKYDFRKFEKIDKKRLENKGIDVCYVAKKYAGKIKKLASVYSTVTRMGMHILSDQPGLQFYTGNMMEKKYQGKHGRDYGPQYALCLEPQFFPDSINNINFQSPILLKNKQYESNIVIKLENNFNE